MSNGALLSEILPVKRKLALPDLVDVYFGAIGEVEAQREISGGKTWRASLLGSCLRRQWLELKDRRPYPPPDARTQRVFHNGHVASLLIGLAFDSLGVLQHGRPGDPELSLSDDTLDVGAHVDFVIGGPVQGHAEPHPMLTYFMGNENAARRLLVVVRERVRQTYGLSLPVIGVELKSKSSKSFWWAKKNKEHVAGANQLVQAACYDLLARRKGLQIDKWVVLSQSKDDLMLAEDEVTEKHRTEAVWRLQRLNLATSAQDLPCSCVGPGADFGKNTWKYCPFGVSETECC